MWHRSIAASAGIPLLLVAACAHSEEPAPQMPGLGDAACNADAVQDLIGQTVNQELGATAMARSGARSLRWIPAGSAVTMDYRPDRLNIGYDSASAVTDINCG